MWLNRIVIRVRLIMLKHWVEKQLHFCHIRQYFKSTKQEKFQFLSQYLLPQISNSSNVIIYIVSFAHVCSYRRILYPPKGLQVLIPYSLIPTLLLKVSDFCVPLFLILWAKYECLIYHKIRLTLNLYFGSCSKKNVFLEPQVTGVKTTHLSP